MYRNGDTIPKDRAAAARLYRAAWKGRRPEAPFFLGRYYYTQALDAERRQIRQGPGVQAMYWLSIAYKIDPVPENRSEAMKLAQLLNNLDPGLNVSLNEWLETSKDPPPLNE